MMAVTLNSVPFAQACKLWLRIGLLSFGGPAGQIALLHKEVVDQRQWLSENEFLRALNFCMLLPGPEAMQLATYCGWKQHGQKGGLAAGLFFVLPGACIMLALSILYALVGTTSIVQSLFWGIKAAVLAIVFEALLKISGRALKRPRDWALAAIAFIALFAFALPFFVVVMAAGIFGFAWALPTTTQPAAPQSPPPLKETLRTTAIWLVVWLLPLAILNMYFGTTQVFAKLGNIFSTLAVVTFGGAYAVLASLGQTVVEQSGWIRPQQMIDGFGLAETTPGPLILVGQFVAFTAANAAEGNFAAGIFASIIFLWMTFVPCFLWIFAFAPWIDWLDSWPRLRASLQAITAAVTGVILNLSLWFGLHVVFHRVSRLDGPIPLWWPDFVSLDLAALLLALILGLALMKWKLGIPKTLASGLVAGLLWMSLRPLI